MKSKSVASWLRILLLTLVWQGMPAGRGTTRLAGVSHHQRKRGASMQDLQGKVTFITGGGRGLGRELSRCCIACDIKNMLADVDEKGMAE